MIADLKLEGLGRALQLQLDFNPLLSDLSGSISQLPFEGANLSALCRLTLDKEAKRRQRPNSTVSSSRLRYRPSTPECC